MLVAGKFAWVPHVKLPVKCLWYSSKFTCARRQFACGLREVLAASKQVNLPVFTGKLHVTQVNCARDLFTCELQVKLPAFAGNFARASFTVYTKKSKNFLWLFCSQRYLLQTWLQHSLDKQTPEHSWPKTALTFFVPMFWNRAERNFQGFFLFNRTFQIQQKHRNENYWEIIFGIRMQKHHFPVCCYPGWQPWSNNDYAMTWYDHGDSYSPYHDHGKIMSWSSWNTVWSWHGHHGK